MTHCVWTGHFVWGYHVCFKGIGEPLCPFFCVVWVGWEEAAHVVSDGVAPCITFVTINDEYFAIVVGETPTSHRHVIAGICCDGYFP